MLIAAGGLVLATCAERENDGGRTAGIPQGKTFRAEVESVTDGDTLDLVTASGQEVTVRLIGIDTPEVYGGVECGGRAASAAMARLATGEVTVRTDPTQDRLDRYGRLLAYVNKGSLDLGQDLIARGFAIAYVYDEVFIRYPAYHRSEEAAKSADRGSWSRCDMAPG
ncbi:MAG: thermonuclease family protein [Solirubrobacterales bacterium]